MSIPPAATEPSQYRVTFFFGPEPVEHRPDLLRCVFNVKKRSWKGGIQVSLDIAMKHVEEARRAIGFSTWVEHQLHKICQEERAELTRRADELFIQSVCTCALNLALHGGIEQHNQVIDAARFTDELRQIMTEQPEQVMERIRLELDLEESPDR
ncbi:MAG: hypothetical protein KF854_13020 [Nitrospira sp.]|nr:hypothetical protein [Nitrospira sp.]HMV56827.1 hypothetical protein [Nitrospira sp.]HMW85800.1 hypothetical protein [Nitrospira sp.]HNA46168.1 hypothetical protein [Nitrospira sp.]HNA86629.1 hypothetical protein [Nitrospira sp.]